jgi:BASS family bile acid:Na+ symporter
MPLSIAALNFPPLRRARQRLAAGGRAPGFVVQLLPLGLGMALRQFGPGVANALEPVLRRVGTALLGATVLLLLANLWEVTINAGSGVLAAIVTITFATLAAGQLLGGPEPSMRTAVAIGSAARNGGLALLVATRNDAPPAVVATILVCLLVSAFAIVPYVAWRRRNDRQAHKPASG